MADERDPIRKRVAVLNWVTLVLSGIGFLILATTKAHGFGFSLFLAGMVGQMIAVYALRCQRCDRLWWSWTEEEREKLPGYFFAYMRRRNPRHRFSPKNMPALRAGAALTFRFPPHWLHDWAAFAINLKHAHAFKAMRAIEAGIVGVRIFQIDGHSCSITGREDWGLGGLCQRLSRVRQRWCRL